MREWFKGPALKALIIVIGVMIIVSAFMVIVRQGEQPDRRNLLAVGVMTVLCMANLALLGKIKGRKK